MEDLTKHQIVLLTLLVSFVTSIATGIVTITLMDQAPQGVTQTINRIVERTVERVVPAETQNASVITKEVTVVVNEDDLVTDTVAIGSENVVRILEKEQSGIVTFRGLGVVITADGIVATDITVGTKGGELIAELPNKNTYGLRFLVNDEDAQLSLMALLQRSDEEEITFSPLDTIQARTLKLGQGIVALGGSEGPTAATGIISKILDKEVIGFVEQEDGTQATSTKIVVQEIFSSVSPEPEVFGGPLLTFFGEIVGIHTNTRNGSATYTPIDNVFSLVNTYRAERVADADTEE